MKIFAFDFDGVIVDSTYFLKENYRLFFLKNYNIKLDDQDYEFILNNTLENIIDYFFNKYKIPLTKKELEDFSFKNEDLFLKNFKNSIHIKKLKELLKFLKEKNFRIIILSHSPFDRISKAIDLFEISHYFDDIVYDEKIITDKIDYYLDYIHYNNIKEAYLLDDSLKIVLKACKYKINSILYHNPLRYDLDFIKKFKRECDFKIVKNFEEVKLLFES